MIAQQRLYPGRIHHAMRWLGVSRSALSTCSASGRSSRSAHGTPLSEKQTVQNWIADSAAEMQAARLMTLHAAWKMDTEGGAARRARRSRLIKFYGAKVLHDVIDRALQLHGSLGYSTDLPLESMYRDRTGGQARGTGPTRCTASPSPSRSSPATSPRAARTRLNMCRPGARPPASSSRRCSTWRRPTTEEELPVGTNEVVIVAAVRTPVGRGHREKGYYKDLHPNELLGTTYTELFERSGVEAGEVGMVIGGCVHQYGEQGLNVARNAWLQAGLPMEVPATTLDLQCGSAQQSVNFAAALIAGGIQDVAVGGGVEHMGHIPIGVGSAHEDEIGVAWPPEFLERYPVINQGISAGMIADKWEIPRSELDELAVRSHQRGRARQPRRGASIARSSRLQSTATPTPPIRASARTPTSRRSRS